MKTLHFLAALLFVPSLVMSGTVQARTNESGAWRMLAAGTYTRKPPVAVTPSMVPSVPERFAPAEISASQILGGCGGRRLRDPQTRRCRGPADLGN
jgi:hypothetical protein